MTDVRAKIAAGDYETKLPWNSSVTMPEVLKKSVSKLTTDEMATIVEVKASYEADLAAARSGREARRADEARLMDEFRRDLENENGMVGHPKAGLLWDKAKSYSDGDGLTGIMLRYEDLVELVK